ncbi:MAG: hypothetical protein ACKOGA_12410, partial [Planctomycetaceae bacterium]
PAGDPAAVAALPAAPFPAAPVPVAAGVPPVGAEVRLQPASSIRPQTTATARQFFPAMVSHLELR